MEYLLAKTNINIFMDLVIYGDSYAVRCDRGHSEELSWPEILNQNLSVTNFAHTGSDIWYSWRRFKQSHHRFTKVVFICTAFHRLPVRGMDGISSVNVSHLEWHRSHSDGDVARRTFAALRDHMLWSQDPQHSWDCYCLIIDDVIRLRPDALIINAFDGCDFSPRDSFAQHRDCCRDLDDPLQNSLWRLSDLDHRHLGISPGNIRNDIRHCHLNAENNHILAEEILLWVETGQQPLRDLSKYKATGQDAEHYFPFEL